MNTSKLTNVVSMGRGIIRTSQRALFAVLLLLYPLSMQAQVWESTFQHLLDSVFSQNKDALGVMIHVESPSKNISWSAAVGFAERSRESSLKPTQPVLIASNTKTYVAAAILRLVENGRIKLDEPMGAYLNGNTRKLLADQGYNLAEITFRHLLSHTSGIQDYVTENYFKFVGENRQYQWSRAEQIGLSMEQGKPQSKAGAEYHYGDINYILLTEVIEELTNKPFYEAMRVLLKFQELGLQNTWFVELEPTPKNADSMAHQYANGLTWDSDNINPSWDLYGGGGLASTVKDAALFFQYLFEQKIVQDPRILKELYTYVLPSEVSKYCLGMYHFDFGYHLYYHGGWWGTDVNYSPETNTSIAVFTLVKEKRGDINPFLGKSIQSLLHEKSK